VFILVELAPLSNAAAPGTVPGASSDRRVTSRVTGTLPENESELMVIPVTAEVMFTNGASPVTSTTSVKAPTAISMSLVRVLPRST